MTHAYVSIQNMLLILIRLISSDFLVTKCAILFSPYLNPTECVIIISFILLVACQARTHSFPLPSEGVGICVVTRRETTTLLYWAQHAILPPPRGLLSLILQVPCGHLSSL